MRILVILVMLCRIAAASEYDVAWSTFGIGLGKPGMMFGDLATRMAPGDCAHDSCSLSSRLVIGGGIGRWGVEVAIAGVPLENLHDDGFPTSRMSVRYGPSVRYTLVRGLGFDIALRGGISYGTLSGDPRYESMVDLEHETTITTEIDGPSYGVWALSAGATFLWRIRVDGGYYGIQADVDYSAMRVAFGDGGVTGSLLTGTYGIVFGAMFDDH